MSAGGHGGGGETQTIESPDKVLFFPRQNPLFGRLNPLLTVHARLKNAVKENAFN